ncbi:Fc.00g058670.m01.CDS01 [Cosmosporella sp. VM-42]
MAGLTFIYTTLLIWVTLAAASRKPEQPPVEIPIRGQRTSHGCYKSLSATASRMEFPAKYLSVGHCGYRCTKAGKAVMMVGWDRCLCADTYPPPLSLVDDDQCNWPCPGFGIEACGGQKVYGVFNTGLKLDVEDDDNDAGIPATSSSASASTCIANIIQPTCTPCPSCSAFGDISDAAHTISTAAVKFVKKIQVFLNDALNDAFRRPGSDQTKPPSEETEVLEEVSDLKI